MRKLFFDCGTRDVAASVGLLVLRVGVGLMMLIGHGIPKIQDFSEMAKGFGLENLPIFNMFSPTVNLLACLVGEVLASALIVLGLATRPAAFLLGFTMTVAAFGVLGPAPFFMGPGVAAAKEPAVLYLLPALVLILTGAGTISFDALLFRDQKRRRW